MGKRIIIFPVKMESGMYLEFQSLKPIVNYTVPKGEFIQDVQVEGNIPSIREG